MRSLQPLLALFRRASALRTFGPVLLLASPALAGGITPHGTQPPISTPIYDESECAICHRNYDARDIEPWNTWGGTMMANAARDPIFWAALDVANNDLPNAGEFCLRCHAPKAWLEGFASGADADGCALRGTVDDPAAGAVTDFSGVTCHFCHRLKINEAPPDGEDPFYLENAELWIDDGDCGGKPCRRGPYDYTGGDPDPPHTWAYSPYHEGADLCGACHNVTSPVKTLIDENGVDTGIPYPIERTHKEWTQSTFADQGAAEFATCQNCHMPDSDGPDAYACFFEEIDRSGDLPIHFQAGGNTWVPAILGDPSGPYSALAQERDEEFAIAIAAALDMLQNRSAAIAVEAPDEVGPGGTLPVAVTVTNLSGHKLPTGYFEGRRMWLQLVARDATDAIVFESGAYDSDTGVLTRDPQIKVYESVRGTWNATTETCEHTDGLGVEQFHFVLNDCIVSDNRIPPLGFTGGADPETQPVAYAYPETSPGSGVLVNYDVTTYRIDLPPDAVSPIDVTATLRYQTASKEYIEFLLTEAVDNGFPDDCLDRTVPIATSRGEFLYDLWNLYGKSPPVDMVLAADSVVIDAQVFDDGFESGDTGAWSATVGN